MENVQKTVQNSAVQIINTGPLWLLVAGSEFACGQMEEHIGELSGCRNKVAALTHLY